MPAMFLKIINDVCMKIIISPANIWSTLVWIPLDTDVEVPKC
jgi:hypothetical protein